MSFANKMSTLTLRKIAASDTENIVKWRNSDSVKRNLYAQSELTAAQHMNWLRTKVQTGACEQFIISVDENNIKSDIGTVFIKNIDLDCHKGEFGIFIGEESARGKGYAKKATKAILKIAFEVLSLHRVYLTVFTDNTAAIKAYEAVGFQIEGRLVDDFLRRGEYVDVYVMGITKDMWEFHELDANHG